MRNTDSGWVAPEVHVEGAEQEGAEQEGATDQHVADGHEEHDHQHDHEHLDVPDNASVHSHTSSKRSAAGTPSSPPTAPKSYNIPPATVERSGLCVICQDEEVSCSPYILSRPDR